MSASSGPVAYIDLSALAHNFAEVSRLVGPDTGVLAMVKSDAYGHGASAIAAHLAHLGCTRMGVATLDECVEVRKAAPGAECVVFGGILPDDAERAVAIGAAVATSERAVCEALAAAAVKARRSVRIHIKVDTGMHRLGLAPGEVGLFVGWLDQVEGVDAVGVCSHFACAESVTGEVTRGQVEGLSRVATELGTRFGSMNFHLANSAAIMTRPEAYLDVVRPGLMLYGLTPDPSLAGKAELRRVMRLEAPVIRVAKVAKGEGIGYGHTFTTKRDSVIATLRCGYADGYPRALSNQGTVRIRNCIAPVVGRVCMDHTMIDVTDVVGVSLGDSAEMWGPGNSTEDQAALAGTIPYELVARVGKRVRREPVQD